MSADYEALAAEACDYYVMSWKTATAPANVEAIEAIAFQAHEGKEDSWVQFRYLTGDFKGCVSGAPVSRVFSAADAPPIFEKLSAAKAALTRKADFASSVKDIKNNLLKDLSKADREL